MSSAGASKYFAAAVAVWGVMMLAGIAYQTWCEYDVSVLRPCVTGRHAGGACGELSWGASCAKVATIQQLSPRVVGKLLALFGPLVGWLPALATLGWLERGLQRASLRATFAVFLATIWVFRACHSLLSWDPSGHMLVLGLSWVVFAALLTSPSENRRRVTCSKFPVLAQQLGMMSMFLIPPFVLYFSFFTAAFFHTPSETLAGAVGALLAALLLPLLSSPAGGRRSDGAAREGEEGVSGWWLLAGSVALWGASVVALAMHQRQTGNGVDFTTWATGLGFDILVIVLFAMVNASADAVAEEDRKRE
jgi:hypothetical protein